MPDVCRPSRRLDTKVDSSCVCWLQVVTTLAAVAYVAMAVTGVAGPAAVVLGGGLALSSTAVAMQVLQDRNETGSRHGRATFAVLLLQVRPKIQTMSTESTLKMYRPLQLI